MPNRIYTNKRPSLNDQSKGYLRSLPKNSLDYVKSLFPIAQWIGRYNLTWFAGDLVAGLTAGAVIIPQGMAYAKIVGLPPEYGLYSSFVGVSIYFLFATSKDMTIGPTAVVSLILGQIIAELLELPGMHFTAIQLASALSLFSGMFSLIFGILRLGFIVDFIPSPVIAGFMTGSAITISIGQISKLLGIKGIKTTEATYLVLGKTLGALGKTKIDAAFGIPFLIYLYLIKYGSRYAGRRWPHRERFFFFIEILRNISAVIIGTLISYFVNHGLKKPIISILTNVPSGIHVSLPVGNAEMFRTCGTKLITVTFILILEHVAIAKSFGRINDYKVNESQELIAIGITNVIGSLFNGYPSTGSFSRTAIKSKSGVRTPLAGVFSGILVIIALYSTAAFYYIPDSVLAAVIIHAVLDLISSPAYVKQLWKISYFDTLIFVTGVVVSLFSTIENGIYASALLALAILLLRIARPGFNALGRLPLQTTKGDEPKYAYVPLNNPTFESVMNPPDGVLILRFVGPLVYPNAKYLDGQIVDYVRIHTKKYSVQADKKGDRPWNEPTNKINEKTAEKGNLPRLNAIIYDFSAVGMIDSTGISTLIDIRKELNKYSNHNVEYHFANITNINVEDSLIIAGFDTLNGNGFIDDEAIIAKSAKDDDGTTIIAKGDEESVVVDKPKILKKFFHLTIDEALAAATNTPL